MMRSRRGWSRAVLAQTGSQSTWARSASKFRFLVWGKRAPAEQRSVVLASELDAGSAGASLAAGRADGPRAFRTFNRLKPQNSEPEPSAPRSERRRNASCRIWSQNSDKQPNIWFCCSGSWGIAGRRHGDARAEGPRRTSHRPT